jgi:nitrite reductase/ring-hydroxylating ferredoxin subunit
MEHKLGIKINDLEDDLVVSVSANNLSLAVVKHEGKIYALDSKCTHEGGPLGEGHIDNGELICPWHSGAFSLESGAADENTPWVTDVKSYRVRVDATTGDIYVEE